MIKHLASLYLQEIWGQIRKMVDWWTFLTIKSMSDSCLSPMWRTNQEAPQQLEKFDQYCLKCGQLVS